MVAQKVWDDKSLLNVDFSLICSNYSLQDINLLEKQARRLPLNQLVPCHPSLASHFVPRHRGSHVSASSFALARDDSHALRVAHGTLRRSFWR